MNGYAPSLSRNSPRWWRRFVVAARRANIFLILEIVAALTVIAMAVATYYAFTSTPTETELLPSRQVATLLIGALIPAMCLLVLFGRRMAIRRAAGSTARLHVRLVFFFSLIAAVPTLLVAAFAAVLFQTGVDFWFSDNSRGLMQNANQLAEGYYEQNQLQVANQTITMAADMRAYFGRATLADPEFADFYSLQTQGRELNESAILQKLPDGELRIAAILNLNEDNDIQSIPNETIERIESGESVVVTGDLQRIEAVAAIDKDSGIYLYNARNPEALSFKSWESATAITQAYQVLTTRARALQLRFNLALFFVSLALVGLAVWFALRFADRQVEPLTDLVAAARKVGAGNFELRVDGRTGADEIGMLNRAFNRMTAQLEKQTKDLVGANEQLDERRAFMEALLESTSAGIISVDGNGDILLMNSTAKHLLLTDADDSLPGAALSDLAPQVTALLDAQLNSGIVNHNKGGDLLTLAVKISDAAEGRVITFEDITRQLLDQRQAAWSDVARRIAHEIKNPLTPIQLATERLKRRYRKQIEQDGELFDDLTNTIVRQVGDLRKMVDEFSSFARLPKPVFRAEDATDLVRQAMFLQEVGNSEIDFSFSTEIDGQVFIDCDRHQVGQAMTNVLKNAVEAVEARAKNEDIGYRGRISVQMSADETHVTVAVDDNGVGLPQDSDRIAEPYVTTREKGTGLGLAIVTKIVEEHGGDMLFAAGEVDGTRVTLRFARDPHLAQGETA